jgi:hypothetical protein
MTTKEVKVHKQITTYSDICGHRTTVSLVSVWDGEEYKYQVIKTWNTFPKDPCIWQYWEYGEALNEFKRIASEAAEDC